MAAVDVDSGRTAEAVRELHDGGATTLIVTWLMVLGDRETYAARVRAALDGRSIAVVVLREALFENVNAVMSDIVRLIESNRETCMASWPEDADRVSVLILARTPLQVPQVSSPVRLPDWVPCSDGRQTLAVIRDLTFSVDVPLSADELAAGGISEALYDLDATIMARITDTARSQRALTNDFWARIRRNPQEDLERFLADAQIAHRQVQAPASFRPSVREARSPISRLWKQSIGGNGEVVKAAAELEQCLALPDSVATPAESILTVIRRPTARFTSSGHKFAYDLLVTTGGACQLVTSAAHADNYARYPTVLLASLSRDLRRSLAAFERLLGELPPATRS